MKEIYFILIGSRKKYSLTSLILIFHIQSTVHKKIFFLPAYIKFKKFQFLRILCTKGYIYITIMQNVEKSIHSMQKSTLINNGNYHKYGKVEIYYNPTFDCHSSVS